MGLNKAMRVVILLIALLGATPFLFAQARAQEPEPPTFGIRPVTSANFGPQAFFTYIVEPGATISDQAIVANLSDETLRLSLYAADGVTAINGSASFTAAGETARGVKDWVSTDVSEISLQPRDAILIPFTLRVPPDTPEGDHVAGLVVEAPPKPVDDQLGVTIVERAGVAVVVRVPGPGMYEDLALGDTCVNRESGSNYFQVVVNNPGTMLVKAQGSFTLVHRDAQQVIFERPAELGSVIPGDATVLRLDAPFEVPPGKYTATTVLHTPSGKEVSTSSDVEVGEKRVNTCVAEAVAGEKEEPGPPFIPSFGGGFPWWWILLALLGALLVIALAVREYRRRRRAGLST